MSNVGPFHSETTTSATLDEVLTSVMKVQTRNYKRLFCLVTASVVAFDQFVVYAKPHAANTVYATIASTSGGFTSPIRPMLGASGNLTALDGATGWFYMDVEAIDEVDIKLAFAAANGTYVIDVGLQ